MSVNILGHRRGRKKTEGARKGFISSKQTAERDKEGDHITEEKEDTTTQMQTRQDI